MSALLREACAEARKGNNNIRQQVRDIGSTLVNNVEISAQEAVYSILQLPLTKPSQQIVFINTSPPDERVAARSCLPVETFIDDNKNDDDDEHSKVTSSKIKEELKQE